MMDKQVFFYLSVANPAIYSEKESAIKELRQSVRQVRDKVFICYIGGHFATVRYGYEA